MVRVGTESLLNKIVTKWMSRIILRSPPRETLMKYREIEKIKMKMVHISSHLSFNETCIQNIYIYINEDIGFQGCLNYCNLKFVWVRLKYKTTHGSEAEPPPK